VPILFGMNAAFLEYGRCAPAAISTYQRLSVLNTVGGYSSRPPARCLRGQ
jgi:hypothetical protein